MFDNFLKHNILEQILQYKTMFYMKKDVFVSLENFHEFFPKRKNFDKAFINLLSNGYISIKEEDGIKKVNLQKEGIYALNNNTFKKDEYKIWWTYIKDGGSLFLAILMAIIAIVALKKDESKFADKEDLKDVKKEIIRIKNKINQKDSQQVIKTYTVDTPNKINRQETDGIGQKAVDRNNKTTR